MKKITPFLWFDNKAEEAAKFYVSIFRNSKIGRITRYGEEGAAASGRPAGRVMTATFKLNGQEFTALNGGPQFTFSQAVSVEDCLDLSSASLTRRWPPRSEFERRAVAGLRSEGQPRTRHPSHLVTVGMAMPGGYQWNIESLRLAQRCLATRKRRQESGCSGLCDAL